MIVDNNIFSEGNIKIKAKSKVHFEDSVSLNNDLSKSLYMYIETILFKKNIHGAVS